MIPFSLEVFRLKPLAHVEQSLIHARTNLQVEDLPMQTAHFSSNKFAISMIAAPFILFAIYVAWIVVPLVVTAVVPAVVRAITTN
jgi:hypothetical protein